ncbi:hypothetical protein MTO96_018104 [Rhipicephalus appendiculatus]
MRAAPLFVFLSFLARVFTPLHGAPAPLRPAPTRRRTPRCDVRLGSPGDHPRNAEVRPSAADAPPAEP